jgi:hypothetical protein
LNLVDPSHNFTHLLTSFSPHLTFFSFLSLFSLLSSKRIVRNTSQARPGQASETSGKKKYKLKRFKRNYYTVIRNASF